MKKELVLGDDQDINVEGKVLSCYYTDKSGYNVVRVYLKPYFEQAQKDYEMMQGYASDCRTWKLENIDVFGI